jgi:hypothetical protein
VRLLQRVCQARATPERQNSIADFEARVIDDVAPDACLAPFVDNLLECCGESARSAF